MGVPTSEVGYTIATTRRETTKVHKNMWWHWGEGGDVEVAENVSMVIRWHVKCMVFIRNIIKLNYFKLDTPRTHIERA